MSTQPYAVWHPFTVMPDRAADLRADRMATLLLMIEDGEGAWVRDRAGRRYLNLFNAATVIGLGRREVIQRVADALQQLSFYPLFAGGHPLAQTLATRLLTVAPPQFRMVFYANDGSGAVETALKMARQYFLLTGAPQRRAFISLRRAYHGASYGALSLTDLGLHPLYEPMLPGCHTVPAPHPFRPPFESSDPIGGCLDALEACIQEIGPKTVAAVILEPVQGMGGFVPLPQAYLQGVRDITRRHGILLIADEVTTGFGRLGAWFAGTRWPIDADVMVVSKGLTGGYFPMGATLATAEIYDAFAGPAGGFPHGWTTSGHPGGCAAALAVLEIIERERLVDNAARQGTRLLQALRSTLGSHPLVGDIRGEGLMIGVEVVADRSTKAPPDHALTKRLTGALREAGILAALVNGVIGLYPPLSITDAQTDDIAWRLQQAFETLGEEPVSPQPLEPSRAG